jgi:hypothetical protein
MRTVHFFILLVMLIIPALLINCAPPPVYVNDFEITPTPITQGENATLRWDTSGAARVTIDSGVGDVPAYGTLSVGPAVTTTYSLTAKNGVTSVQKTLTLKVNTRPPAPVAAPVQIPTVSALDTEKLLSYMGKEVQVEGDITYISSWLPSRYLAEGALFPWTFVFFMSNPWEGADSSLNMGYPCVECWRDYTAYFRAIIKPEYINNFLDPSSGSPTLYAGQHVVIHGTLTGYLSAPAIYLTSASQVTAANP